LKNDLETIAAVRSVTKKPLRVDANEGWTDKDEAVRKINWLETQGVEFIEQPMPAHMFEETKYVRSKVHLPIMADEACTSAAAIPKLQEAYDGINVKLDKAGGILEAHRWISMARAMDMKVMLGCMISSPSSAVLRINTCVFNTDIPKSSLHLGHFQRVGEVQIQVLQQYRLVLGRSTDAALADDYSVARW